MRCTAISHRYMGHTQLVERIWATLTYSITCPVTDILHHMSSPYSLPNRLKAESMEISISSMSYSLLSNREKTSSFLRWLHLSEIRLIISFGRKERDLIFLLPSAANSANIDKFDEEKKEKTGGESRRKQAGMSKSANEFIINALEDSCELWAVL